MAATHKKKEKNKSKKKTKTKTERSRGAEHIWNAFRFACPSGTSLIAVVPRPSARYRSVQSARQFARRVRPCAAAVVVGGAFRYPKKNHRTGGWENRERKTPKFENSKRTPRRPALGFGVRNRRRRRSVFLVFPHATARSRRRDASNVTFSGVHPSDGTFRVVRRPPRRDCNKRSANVPSQTVDATVSRVEFFASTVWSPAVSVANGNRLAAKIRAAANDGIRPFREKRRVVSIVTCFGFWFCEGDFLNIIILSLNYSQKTYTPCISIRAMRLHVILYFVLNTLYVVQLLYPH